MAPRLTLARPREVPFLKLLGWEEVGPWSQSFTILRLANPPPDTSLIVDLRKIVEGNSAQA